MEADFFECTRRCFGRRLHPQTFKVFHLDDNPPNKKFFLENKTENQISKSNSLINNSNNNSNNNINIKDWSCIANDKKNSIAKVYKDGIITENTQHYNFNNNNCIKNKIEEYNRTFRNNYNVGKRGKFGDADLVDRDDLICENLISFENFSLAEAQFAVMFLSFENNLPNLMEFYKGFGFEKEGEKLFQSFQANKNVRITSDELMNKINFLSDINEKYYENILKKFDLESYNFGNSNSNSKIVSELPLIVNPGKNEISNNNMLIKNSILSNSVENYVNLNDNLDILNASDNKTNNNNNINNKLESENKENFDSEKEKQGEDIETIKLLEKSKYIKSNLNSDIAYILFVIWKKI